MQLQVFITYMTSVQKKKFFFRRPHQKQTKTHFFIKIKMFGRQYSRSNSTNGAARGRFSGGNIVSAHCACKPRIFRTNRLNFTNKSSGRGGCGSGVSVIAQAPKGHSAVIKDPQYNYREANRKGFALRRNMRVRQPSTFFAIDKRQTRSEPLCDIRFAPQFLPRGDNGNNLDNNDSDNDDDDGELPVPYYNAPRVFLPASNHRPLKKFVPQVEDLAATRRRAGVRLTEESGIVVSCGAEADLSQIC